MPRTRTTKTSSILKLLAEGALTTSEIFLNAALAPLRVSYRGIPGPLQGKRLSIQDAADELMANLKERRQFYGTLSNLKRDGLISLARGQSKRRGWTLSDKGKLELEKIKEQPKEKYLKTSSSSIIVISYDIPEGHRKTRGWLRSVLRLLDFKMLHKSVWLGTTEIPRTLLDDLRERKVMDFVHIFSIGKKGSLEQVL